MIRLGAVGAGMVFRRYQAAIDQLSDVGITAVADPDPMRRKMAQRPNRRICSTADELLDQPLDAVLVLTPNAAHGDVVKACLKRGLATLCEKPLATTADVGRELVDLARQQQIFLFPAMHCRYRPEIRYLQDYCKDAIAAFEHVWHEDWRDAPGWYRDPLLSGGGVLLDVGINQIDWLWRTAGPMIPRSIRIDSTGGSVEDECVLDCQFSRGAGTVSLSWRGAPQRRHTKLCACNGETLEVNHDLRTVRHRGATHGPWNDDEYAGVLRDFITQLQQPEIRDSAAGDHIISLLSFIGGIYAGQGLISGLALSRSSAAQAATNATKRWRGEP